MGLSKITVDVENISALSDQPNIDDGLSAEELKAIFDKASVDIKTGVNKLIDELEKTTDGSEGASNIGASAIYVGDTSGTNVQAKLELLQVQNDNLKNGQLNNNAIATEKINDNAITTSKINNNAVTTEKINDSAITTNKIINNAITSDKINAGAVTSDKIDVNVKKAENLSATSMGEEDTYEANIQAKLNGLQNQVTNVSQGGVADNSIGTSKIINSAVTTDKINAGAITTEKLDNTLNNSLAKAGELSRVDRYNTPAVTKVEYGTETLTTGDIIPKIWTEVTAGTKYSSGGIVLEASSFSSLSKTNKACDGDTDTCWESATNLDNTLKIYFPEKQKITKMKLQVERYDVVFTSCLIQASNDDSTWIDLYTITGELTSLTEITLNNPNWYNYYRIKPIFEQARRVRVYEWQVSEYYTKNYYNLLTLDNNIPNYFTNQRLLLDMNSDTEEFNTNTIIAMTSDDYRGYKTSGDYLSSYYPYYACDGNDNTYYISTEQTSSRGYDWTIELPYLVKPSTINIRTKNLTLSASLQGSVDGTTWDTLSESIGNTSSNTQQDKTLNITTNNYYKYFRIVSPSYYNSSNNSWYLYIFEITSGSRTVYNEYENSYININNLGNKLINGTITENKKYELVYNGTSFDVNYSNEEIEILRQAIINLGGVL